MIVLASDGTLTMDMTASGDVLQDRIFLSLATPLGSLWQRPDFGSELHTLRRAKMTPALPSKAEAMVRDALAWMLDEGLLSSLDVQAVSIGGGRLKLTLKADTNNQPVVLDYWVAVPADPR